MSRRGKAALIAAVVAVSAGVLISQVSGTDGRGARGIPGSPEDAGPRGLLALVALLDATGHDVRRIGDPASEADLDPEATTVLISPGTLTAGDAEALADVAAEGGRVVVAGDPGDKALEALLETQAKIEPGGAASQAPLTVAPETAGVAQIEGNEPAVVDPAGSALPITGAPGSAGVVATGAGEGRVIVAADASIFENELIVLEDNARFALNLAGATGRHVQLIEAVRTPPASGLAALPAAWGWAAGGLLLGALALAWSRGRRLGPVEVEARPLGPPRREYVDAVAGALMRAHDEEAAVARLRVAARDRLARRSGLARDAAAEEVRAAALAAGLGPEEASLLEEGGSEDAILTAANALAKLSRRTESV